MGKRATLTSKGQITIPKAVRELMGLEVGDQIEFVEEDGTFRVRKHVQPGSFRRYRGYLQRPGERSEDIVDEMRGR
jgi:antitoxin PrlF